MPPHPDDTIDLDAARPRRVAVLSDVHANLPAFRAVLEDARRAEVDAIWCLGDLVGYGAEPDACVALAAEACDLCLAGNHDLVVLGTLDIAEFSAPAAIAARWTQDHLGQEARSYLESLSPTDGSERLGLYHASPRDPVWEYVLSTVQADLCMDAMEPRVGAIGHSHVALWFERDGAGRAAGTQASDGAVADLREGRWLLNPGGVGQPRDGDPRAAWLLLDLETWTATWRRVDYPIDDAAEAIRAAGLPTLLSERLYQGQ